MRRSAECHRLAAQLGGRRLAGRLIASRGCQLPARLGG
jgi:hypothetical protein